MLLDIGIYERDVEKIIKIIGDDFEDTTDRTPDKEKVHISKGHKLRTFLLHILSYNDSEEQCIIAL